MAAIARVTVYSKPKCPQCDMTKRHLERKGITYAEVDVSTNDAALEYVMEELGYSAAPVLVDNDDEQNHWYGFRPDKIDAIAG